MFCPLPIVIAASLLPPVQDAASDAPWQAAPRTDGLTHAEAIERFSGIDPALATFNGGNECGTGAVVVWADRLWWITYPPHSPRGSDDGLYLLDGQGRRWRYAESVGGTHANRMIHRETDQLLIGPYVVDASGEVRTLSFDDLPGRLTGTSRHLTQPQHLVYYATMEEGFAEVDLRDLSVTILEPDANGTPDPGGPRLPGYHGKGLFTGQGVVVYSNNGERGAEAQQRPDVPSGCLAQWDGTTWSVVRRNQFTEVTGPGGLTGNVPDDPVWSLGWDHRSLILMLLDGGIWHTFRLPKTSHCYDGAHGWNTEWPRIRNVGMDDLLMTMHGAFWRFPKTFRAGSTGGIEQRQTYLKVIGDFAAWGDHLVFGCDDAARAEFLNKRKAKGDLAGPAQSQSNLWFVDPDRLEELGTPYARGSVWVDDPVEADTWSDPMGLADFDHRSMHVVHDAGRDVTVRLEVDETGNGEFVPWGELTVGEPGYGWFDLTTLEAEWIRVSLDTSCRATVRFEARDQDHRWPPPPDASILHIDDPSRHEADPRFDGVATLDDLGRGEVRGGLLRAHREEIGLRVLPSRVSAEGTTWSDRAATVTPALTVSRDDDATGATWAQQHVAIPAGVVTTDRASALYVDEEGCRYRLPVSDRRWLEHPEWCDLVRTAREVATERDLFQCAGLFYELPARNAGGFARLRPIAAHDRLIQDYASWRGLLVLTGAAKGASGPRWITQGDTAVWLGTIDDLWSLGKATGVGGPWKETPVRPDVPSDPYLMTGFDRKVLQFGHDADSPVTFTFEIALDQPDQWQTWRTQTVDRGNVIERIPDAFQASWIRARVDTACRATVQLRYQ